MTINELNSIRESLIGKINQTNPQILVTHPIEEFINRINRHSSIRGYKYISRETEKFNQSLIHDNLHNKHIIGVYYNLVLLTLIINNSGKLQPNKFPELVVAEYKLKFDRIIKKIVNWTDNVIYQPLTNDKYLKDLAICRLTMFPVGPQYVEVDKLSRRFLFTGGIRQFVKGFSYVIKQGGFAPFYKLKTNQLDPDLIAQFNPEGWEKMLVCVSQLMKNNPHIKGITGTSWIFDPQLELVDKEIDYVREKFQKIGARFFLHRMNDMVLKDALFLSNKRKKLFQDKIYTPRNYVMVLSRKNLLEYYRSKSS